MQFQIVPPYIGEGNAEKMIRPSPRYTKSSDSIKPIGQKGNTILFYSLACCRGRRLQPTSFILPNYGITLADNSNVNTL